MTTLPRLISVSALCILSLAFLLAHADVARGSDGLCAALFPYASHNAPAAELIHSLLSPADLAGLNDASREYLIRLSYLMKERRLLSTDVLKTLTASPTPLNPFAGQSQNVTLFSHIAAFDALLKEDLQWSLIRQAIEKIGRLTNQQQRREEVAVNETERVLMPVALRTFPDTFARMVFTNQGQLVGVVFENQPLGRSMALKTVDLETGTELSRISYDGAAEVQGMDVRATGDTVLAAIPGFLSSRMLIFDLLKGQLTSAPVTSRAPTKAHFVEKNGELQVFANTGTKVLLIHPLTRQVDPEIEFSKDPTTFVAFSGSVENSVYLADNRGTSYLFNPNVSPALQRTSKIRVITSFSFQGKTYGFGTTADLLSDGQKFLFNGKEQELKSVDFSSGSESSPVGVLVKNTLLPLVIDHFEQEGTVYGLLSTGLDVDVIDLIKGELKQKLSDMPLGARLIPNFRALKTDHSVFEFKGKHYIPAVLPEDDSGNPAQIVILDALTLAPVSAGLPVPSKPSSIEVLPAKDGGAFAVVNFENKTSQLISLFAKRPMGAPK